jgi:hypothetical protein
MRKNDRGIRKILSIAVAIGVLALAPVGTNLTVFAQVTSEDRSEGIENGLSLIVDTVRARIADVIDDARSDGDTDDDYDDLIDDVSSDDDTEQSILDSLDDASSIIQDIATNDNTEIASVLTEFSENEQVVEEADLPDDITVASVEEAVNSVSVDEVTEELTIEAITDEVLVNNSELEEAVRNVLGEFVADALSQPDADLSDLVQNVEDDLEDAVDSHVEEDEVADIISGLSEDDIVDAIDNDDVSLDAASTQAILRELEEPDNDSQSDSGTTSLATARSEIERLQEEIDLLNAKIDQLNALIQGSNSGNTTGQTNNTATGQTNSTSSFP